MTFPPGQVVERWLLRVGLILLLCGAGVMSIHGDLLRPEDVPWFLFGAGVSVIGFLALARLGRVDWLCFWLVAFGLRFVLFWSEPGDDIWRYIWEGRVQLEGFSPYAHPPVDPALEGFRDSDWTKINHPEVSAIYPPLTQLGLRMLSFVSPSVWFFKLAVIVPDLLICVLLSRRFGPTASLVYAWNPMVAVSFAGGGHFDSWFLLPMVAAWLLVEPEGSEGDSTGWGRVLLTACLTGVSVAIKWVTLPMLGWLVWRQLRKRCFGRAAAVLGVGFLPFVLALTVFWMSVDRVGPLVPGEFALKTRGADLVPWVVGQFWPMTRGSNRLFLGTAALAGLILMLTVKRFRTMGEAWISVLLVLGPSNHAWYFTWGLPFAVASRNWGPILLSLSGFTYFQLQLTFALTGRWLLSGFERILLWAPFLAGWVRWLIWRKASS